MAAYDVKDYLISQGQWTESDGDHYPDTSINVKKIYRAGDNSSVTYRTGMVYDGWHSGWTDRAGIYVKVYGETAILPIQLPEGVTIADVHELTVFYDYAITKLRGMSKDKAKTSPYYDLKKDIEKALRGLAGKETYVGIKSITSYISQEEYESVMRVAKAKAEVYAKIGASSDSQMQVVGNMEVVGSLIKQGLVHESVAKKVSMPREKFRTYLLGAIDKHEQRKIAIAVAKNTQKFKTHQKELKAARLKEQKELKMQARQKKAELEESLTGPQL